MIRYMNLNKIYKILLKEYGPQGWWPIFVSPKKQTAKMRVENNLAYNIKWNNLKSHYLPWCDPYFEIAIGAILTQSTAWKNVAQAINSLCKNKSLTPQKILNLSDKELGEMIKPAGYFKQKTKKVKIFCEWLVSNHQGDILKLKNKKIGPLREELLGLWGIGPETADSIILYALNKPGFVIDEYTRRLCLVFGVKFKNYEDYKDYFEKKLSLIKNKVVLYGEYHALIVASGKNKHKNFL